MHKNIKILLNWIISPVLALWLFYSLFKQTNQQSDIQASVLAIKSSLSWSNLPMLLSISLLAIANWGMESLKWQKLINTVSATGFATAFKAVLSGVTLSINTPNRIGEYGGRVLFVKPQHRYQAVSLSIVGSLAQMILTVGFGTLGLYILLLGMNVESQIMGLSYFWLRTLCILSLLGLLGLLLFFFKLSWLIKVIDKMPFAAKFERHIKVLESFDAKFLLILLLLSSFRYIIFVFQYILLLHLMNVELNWWEAFNTVTVLFWVLAVVPSFAIAELGIRGKFAVALLGLYSGNFVGILATTFGIWFINLFVPALVGSGLIIGKKIFKNES